MGDAGVRLVREDDEKLSSTSRLSELHFAVSHRGQTKSIRLDCSSTLEALHDAFAEQFDVLPAHQKIISPTPTLKKAFTDVKSVSQSLQTLGFVEESEKRGGVIKLMLVGPKQDEIDALRKEDEQGARMQAPRKYHPSMLRTGSTPRRTGVADSSTTPSNPFHSLKVHAATAPSAPEYAQIMERLRRLSTDEAVLHVCRIHGFQVGQLTELLPHEHPNLLGLNENMGQRISLRLRTDMYDGLRLYRDTRQVLLHELAHNKVNDHPPEFKILNSELNAQVEAFERAKRQGTHSLMGNADVYEPASTGEGGLLAAQPTSFVLGGGARESGEDKIDGAAARRERVLQATMKRLEKSEADIERGCGSAT
jgi:hypothetical protein